jgi:hypothetical protein
MLLDRHLAEPRHNLPARGRALRARLLGQLSADRRDMVLSAEEMSNSFDATGISALREFLSPHFDAFRVLAYVREPVSMMRSAYQEMLKAGYHPFDPAKLYPGYRWRLEPWEAAFGPDRVSYVLYSPRTLAGGDAVSDFASRIGVAVPLHQAPRANQGLSAEAVAMQVSIHRQLRGNPSAWERARLRASSARIGDFGGHPFEIAEAAWRPFIESQTADLGWIEGRLGAGFPAHAPLPGAIAFESEEQMLELAARQHGAFSDWQARSISTFETMRFLVRGMRGRS